jgi:hypothetical protein
MHHRTTAPVLLALAALSGLVTGCSTASQGQPQPPQTGSLPTTATNTSTATLPTSTVPSGGQLPSDGAPKVKNPLDASRYLQSPCNMLTSAQLQELNLPTEGEPGAGPLGLDCSWVNHASGGKVRIQWADKNPRGLSGDYAAHKAGRFAYFIEYPDIEGLPGVSADLFDDRSHGACSVAVGVTDQLEFLADVQLSLQNIGKKDACEVVVKAAEMMIKTMKGGA